MVDPTVKKAVDQAEESLSLSRNERKELVNCLPSDDEDLAENDIQTMISDDESSLHEMNGQKRKKIDNSCNKDSDDDEVTGRKV